MDIVDYFKKITGLTPIKEQIELLYALVDVLIKNLAVSAGRGFSKTMCSALAVLWFADEYSTKIGRPLEILLISSQKRMYFHLNNFFRDNPELSTKLRQKGMFKEIPVNGFEFAHTLSMVETAMPTSKSIRSHRADLVIIDECADVPDDIITAAMGCLTGDICKLVLISTCHKSGFFTEVADKPKERGFELLQYSSEVCPWQQTNNKRLKELLTKGDYAIEVLGRIPTRAERAFFPSKHLKQCFVNDLNPEGGIREAGLDFGDVVGRNVLTITEKLGIRRKLLFLKVYRKPIEEALPDIADTLGKYHVQIVKADSKPPQNQRAVGKRIGSVQVIYVDCKFHKKQMLGQLQRHIMRHTLTVDNREVELKKQLGRYRPHKRSGDDLVDSLAFSIYEFGYQTKPTIKVFM